MEILNNIGSAIASTSFWEWAGVVTAVVYVILAARRNILCWTFALISSAVYIYLCFISKLYIDSILNLFYFIMGILGWVFWNRETTAQPIRTWGIGPNVINILLSGLLTLLLAYIFKTWTDQANPYTDAFIFAYCLSATYMITKKVHEGWLYLIAIDFASIFLYANRGLYLSSLLYVAYTVIAIFGWIAWYKLYRSSKYNL